MEDLAANSRQFSTALLQKQMKATSQVPILMTQTLNFVQTAWRTVWFRSAIPLYALKSKFLFPGNSASVHSLCFLCSCVLAFQLLQQTTDFILKLGSGCCTIVGYLAVIMIRINR